MPLNKTCSVEAYRQNIRAEIEAGKDPAQAVAIARRTLAESCTEEGKDVPKLDEADAMPVIRYDGSKLGAVEKLDNGYLKCDALLTRIGVFDYLNKDGSIRRELRLPDEVFNADSLKSFEDLSLTNGHPNEAVTSKNSQKYHVGHVRDVRPEGPHVAGRVTITADEAIEAAKKGKKQLSCGYNCDLELTQGVTDGIPGIEDGLGYDAIQRNIKGNHLAIVENGRAGDTASLRLDADDRILVDQENKPEPKQGDLFPDEAKKMLVEINGESYEMDEKAAAAVMALKAKLAEMAEKAVATDQETEEKMVAKEAEVDEAKEKMDAAIKARDEATSPDAIRAIVNERLSLIESARKVLGDTDAEGNAIKFDEMDDGDLMLATVVKASPKAQEKLDALEGDAKEIYLKARFDQAIEAVEDADKDKPNLGLANVRKVTNDGGGDRQDSQSAYDRMIANNQKRGTAPLGRNAN
jgi:hypothetical protein